MLVDELAGPILWARRGQWKAPPDSAKGIRRANIWSPDHPTKNRSVIHLHMTLVHDSGTYRFAINIMKYQRDDAGMDPEFSELGYLHYLMTESFKNPTTYLDDDKRLRTFRRRLTTS